MPASRTHATVTHGLTLKGAQLTWAILEGEKTIENRSVKLPVGWVALHTGSGKLAPEHEARLRAKLPHIPAEARLPHGVIMGAARIDRATTIEGCAGTDSHGWASGPVCNVVGAVAKLARPVAHKGALGLWSIEAAALADLQQQLELAEVLEADPARLPPHAAPPPSPRKRKRTDASAPGPSTSAAASMARVDDQLATVATMLPPPPIPPPPPPFSRQPRPEPSSHALYAMVAKVTTIVRGIPGGEEQVIATLRANEWKINRVIDILKAERLAASSSAAAAASSASAAAAAPAPPPAYAPPLFCHRRRHASTR